MYDAARQSRVTMYTMISPRFSIVPAFRQTVAFKMTEKSAVAYFSHEEVESLIRLYADNKVKTMCYYVMLFYTKL